MNCHSKLCHGFFVFNSQFQSDMTFRASKVNDGLIKELMLVKQVEKQKQKFMPNNFEAVKGLVDEYTCWKVQSRSCYYFKN